MVQPTVRRAGLADLDQLVELRAAMFTELAAAGSAARPQQASETPWQRRAAQEMAKSMAAGTWAAFVVDDVEGRPLSPGAAVRSLACAVATIEQRLPGPGFPTGCAGSMSSVFVVPAHRGQGLARALTVAALAWLEGCGAEVVDLHATVEATPLYLSLGFSAPRIAALRRLTVNDGQR